MKYNRPDVVVTDREENMWYSVDFAIPMDHHVKEKDIYLTTNNTNNAEVLSSF